MRTNNKTSRFHSAKLKVSFKTLLTEIYVMLHINLARPYFHINM